jgi:beta-xylosidase
VGEDATRRSLTQRPGYLRLRVERVGNTYYAYYRTDSSAWTPVGSHSPAFTPWGVALTAAADLSGSSIPADFDYFHCDTMP